MAVYRIVIARSVYEEFEIEADDVDQAISLIEWPQDGHEWELVDWNESQEGA